MLFFFRSLSLAFLLVTPRTFHNIFPNDVMNILCFIFKRYKKQSFFSTCCSFTVTQNIIHFYDPSEILLKFPSEKLLKFLVRIYCVRQKHHNLNKTSKLYRSYIKLLNNTGIFTFSPLSFLEIPAGKSITILLIS